MFAMYTVILVTGCEQQYLVEWETSESYPRSVYYGIEQLTYMVQVIKPVTV